MKMQLLMLALCFMVGSQVLCQEVVEVPAQSTIELEYSDYEMNKVTLKNKSEKGLDVKVLDKASGEQIRGFGLGDKGAKVHVLVEESSKLVLQNKSNQAVQLEVKSAQGEEMKVEKSEDTYITFTLQNKTAKSIPLIIPSVMNPNLSPFSKSGVYLKVGQKIIFKHKGRRHTLLVVDTDIQNDEVIDVAKLLKERKKELGLK